MQAGNYTVGALAKASNTKAVTIRYYEKQGLIPAPPRTESGYRIFSDSDLDRLLFIRRSRHLGFSLDDIRDLLALTEQDDAPCDEVDQKVARQLSQVRERIRQLRALESELQRLSARCAGGSIEDCQIVDALSGR